MSRISNGSDSAPSGSPLPGPSLFVVATPIGNLEDITLRALEVLRRCDFVVCEDTRRTMRLLARYGIRKEVAAAHRFNEEKSAASIIRRLLMGKSAAYVTEGGTPAVSDPGARLVRRAREAGIAVVPIPGASAVTCAMSVAGWEGGFVFAGFAERKRTARMRQIETLSRLPWACVLFESPSRARETLADAAAVLGEREILLAREMTKIHEQVIKAPASEMIGLLPDPPRGEITIMIFPEGKRREQAAVSWAGTGKALSACREMIDAGIRPARAAAIASSLTGIPRRTIIDLLGRVYC